MRKDECRSTLKVLLLVAPLLAGEAAWAQQAPTIVVETVQKDISSSQVLTVVVNVSGGSGTPTGVITLMSNNPPPEVYDTFQYSDGSLIKGLTAQSGNSEWITQGTGIGQVEGYHLLNAAPSGEAGVLYATLANSSALGGTPQPITTIGGTIRMCPSASGTYDPSYTSVGMIASYDITLASHLEIGFGPTSWWLNKQVGGQVTSLQDGTENLPVDCATEYTVQMIIDQAAGTVQVIPPNGVPSPVISDPDITQMDAMYGTWEPENNAPNKYIGEWGSVWLGGSYISESTPLVGGSASIQIPAGSLPAGTDTLIARYTPDANSTPFYSGTSQAVSISVNAAVGFTLAASPPAMSVAQGDRAGSTITISTTGGYSGGVSLSASGLPSGVTASFTPGSAVGTQVITFSAASSALVTSDPAVVTILGTGPTLPATAQVALSITDEPGIAEGSGGTNSIVVAAGATTSNTANIPVVGTNGFSGTVNLSCTVTTAMTRIFNLPRCSLSPASLNINGQAAQDSTLSVATTAPTSAGMTIQKPAWLPASGTALALVVLLMVPRGRRRWQLLVAIIASGGIWCTIGCGSVSNESNGGTTRGAYTVTVTANSGQVSDTVATVSLTVQ